MFELGFALCLLIVFGLGSFLLVGVAVYFIRELVIREDRPSWTVRSRRSKATLLGAALLAGLLLSIPLRMIWVTRIGAIPGTYRASGVWGESRLDLRADGTFHEVWHFKNEYNGKPEGAGSIAGHWRDEGRNWLTRDIVLDPFTPLADFNRGHAPGANSAIVTGYSGVTSIDVDTGADIAFVR